MKYRPFDDHNKTLRNHTRGMFHRRSMIWIMLAVLVLLMSAWIPRLAFEKLYYKGFFLFIRSAYDILLGWSPIPMIYLVVVIFIIRFIYWLKGRRNGFLFQLSRAVGGIACIIFLFYILWGFNYHQIPLQERLGFALDEVQMEDVEKEFIRATEELQWAAKNLPQQYTTDESITSLKLRDRDLRPEVEKVLSDLNLPSTGKVRVRQLWPSGVLLRWGTAGIYIPHAAEGHIDQGLLSVQKPFTMAHEMAHGYGVTDEGACNFIAWLACNHSRDNWIRFGGAFTYWRYTAAEMPHEIVENVIPSLDPIVQRALFLVRENDKKYPDLMPNVRDAIYSSYLKQHGVKGGLRSYNYVVKMVSLYLKEEEKTKSE